MTRGFFLFLRQIGIKCGKKHVCLSTSAKVPRVHVQNPPKRKSNQDPVVNSSFSSYFGHRFNLNSSLHSDIMSKTNQAASDKKCPKVEYLDTPVKSENDTKEYRVIRLQNGLTALLIADLHSRMNCYEDGDQDAASSEDDDDEDSDEGDEDDSNEEDTDEDDDLIEDSSPLRKIMKRNTKMAACGLSVGVGSFSDPPEIPGMAHFLEHMVFMGSAKFPQENDFDSYLSKRGGSSNAETDCEHTTFYFDVQEKHLVKALDRFAQFFIKPLMKKDAITREREAVESEFQIALPYDDNRKEQLFSSFARTGHPASKFVWGNLITLRDNVDDDTLYKELHKFKERHYSAHRMKLSIQARLPLDILEEYVITYFSDVPNNKLPPDDFTQFKGGISFDTSAFRRMYKIKPVKDISLLDVTWAMPSLLDYYKCKPYQYVSWIIGHEGKDSLISYLRKKMWVIDILSGNDESGFEHSSMYALFKLSLILTDEGQKHFEEVLDAVFSFINLLKKEGPQKRIYDDIYKIEEINFRFANEQDPIEYVEDLCEGMHFYPPCDYLTGSELYFEYDPEAIKMCLDYLKPENMNIMIFNGKFDKELDKVEPWFKTKYTDVEIPEAWIERWKIIEPLPDFHLPLPNTFLTSDFTLIPLPADVPKFPVKIHSDAISEIWYRPDPKFRLPECFMYFHFVSPLGLQSAENAVLMELYCNVLKQLLVEEIYPALTAGFYFSANVTERGIQIKLNGLNEKLPLLLFTIMKYMMDSPNLITKELFEILKELQLKIFYNTFIKPKKLARDVQSYLLKYVHYTCVDMYTPLRNVNFEEFQNFIKVFNDRFYIQCLVQGNMTQDAALENVKRCIEIINCKPLPPNMLPEIRIMQIPMGTHYCKLRNMNETDVNSVVSNYYQSGVTSIELSMLIELLIVIMEEPLFNRLRTKEQLGYNVATFCKFVHGIVGYNITIQTQADKYTTEYVDQRIENFLQTFHQILEDFTEVDLNEVKQALKKVKLCVDIDLDEEVMRNWEEILSWRYRFDRLEREVLAIKDIKLNDLREWTKKHTLNGSNFRKLSIHVAGNKKGADNETNNIVEDRNKAEYSLEYITNQNKKTQGHIITDVEAYKNTFYVYPVTEENKPLKESNK